MLYSNYKFISDKWYGTPEGLIAFSSLSITVINTFEGLLEIHAFNNRTIFFYLQGDTCDLIKLKY